MMIKDSKLIGYSNYLSTHGDYVKRLMVNFTNVFTKDLSILSLIEYKNEKIKVVKQKSIRP